MLTSLSCARWEYHIVIPRRSTVCNSIVVHNKKSNKLVDHRNDRQRTDPHGWGLVEKDVAVGAVCRACYF
eukprot:scaffold29871_cov40-Cyclotella_meneghiniana.AAC.6